MTDRVHGLGDDIHRIVDAAVRSVAPESLVARRLSIVANDVLLDAAALPGSLRLRDRGRVVIIGGGKAGAGMAAGLVDVFGAAGLGSDRVMGLVSVPEGCGRPVAGIEIRETRPAAENLPTPMAVSATQEMLDLVGTLAADDLAVAIISGGGSALLAAPREGVPLTEKIALAKYLTAAGAPITEINLVRRVASDVKGGGLARACSAGRMLVLVLSDVIGDPLESIASGPCMPTRSRATEALAVLERYGAIAAGVVPRLVAALREDAARLNLREPHESLVSDGSWMTPRGCRVDHVLLGSNATAVDAAAAAAKRLGYDTTIRHATSAVTETADEVGYRLAHEGLALSAATAADGRPRAIIEGGEAVVRLPSDHGVGGRNQQTVAAAVVEVLRFHPSWPAGLALASIGTDGEDGPTYAAGGMADAGVVSRISERRLDVTDAVARFDALPLLKAVDGLIVTGPTGTNVADVRVLLALPKRDE